MELVFVCKDGDLGSLMSHFVDAITAKKAGVDAGLILAEEALLAIATGEFSPRPVLDKFALAEAIRRIGLPADRDSLLAAARDAHVPIIACGGWTAILGLEGKLPEGVTVGQIGPILLEAKKVIGGF